jgi:hypothetical protein
MSTSFSECALVHLSAALGLAACASGPVHVSADRCWSVAAGDKVEGAAILFVASPFTFHVGPKVAGGRDCPRYPIRFANRAVDKAIARSSTRLRALILAADRARSWFG